MEAVDLTPERSATAAESARAVCLRAMAASGRILTAVTLVPTGNARDSIKGMDVDMLVITGGHERISDEFAAHFTHAGLTAGRVLPRGSPISLLEAFADWIIGPIPQSDS